MTWNLSPAGLYGNDELHKGISDVFGSGRQVERLVKNVRNQVSVKTNKWGKCTWQILINEFLSLSFSSPCPQTESLKYSLKTKVTVSELEDTFDKPIQIPNQNSINIYESVRWVKDNTTLAINALEAVSYLIKSSHSEQTIRRLFDVSFSSHCLFY